MKKEMTRKDHEKMLSYGKNYRPQEITDRKFYFFKGYVIEIFEGGGFYLSKRRMYCSNNPSDILKYAMDKVVELELADFDENEKLKNTVNEMIQKRIEPFISSIVKESIEKLEG